MYLDYCNCSHPDCENPHGTVDEFEVNERVLYLHRGSSRSRTFEIPAVIKEVNQKTYLIVIDGQLTPRFVEKQLKKIRKIPVL
jgi:hypothetical protein